MKQNILGEERAQAKRKIRNRLLYIAVIIIAAAALNILFTMLRSKENQTWMLLANIFVDVVAGWNTVWNVTTCIIPVSGYLRLEALEGITLHGTVESISEQTECYCGYDCFVANIAGHKVFVVDNGTIYLSPSEQVTVKVVHGIVKEVME